MLAAMLPASTHLHHSGPHPAASTSHPSPSPSPAPSKRKPKSQAKAQQPSLIALTKGAHGNAPASSARGPAEGSTQGSPRRKPKQAAGVPRGESASSPSAAKAKAATKKSTAALLAASEAPSASLLSRSAPTAGSNDPWDMPKAAATSGLTWQQELLHGSTSSKKSTAPSSGAPAKQRKSTRKDKDASTASAKDTSPGNEALTWQQALFASNAPSAGRRYDQIQDAQDAATFGDAAPVKNGRARSGSVGNEHQPASKGKAKGKKDGGAVQAHEGHHAAPPSGPIHIDDLFAQQQRLSKATSTPSKPKHQHAPAGLSLPAAYAGPDFHNSPAPNSLPAPKFTRRSERNTSAPAEVSVGDVSFSSSTSSGASGSSSDEDDLASAATRYTRGATAPAAVAAVATPPRPTVAAASPPAPASVDRSATIESLLARMMAPAKPTAA